MKRLLLIILVCAGLHASYKEQNNYHLYIWANYSQTKKDHDVARRCYQLIFTEKPSKHAFPGFIHHLSQTGQFDGIVKLMPTVQKILEPELDVQLLFAQALEQVGNFEQANELLVKLAKQHQHNPEVVYYAAVALVRSSKLTQALALIDSFIENNMVQHKNFIFHFLKSQVLANEGKKEEAAIHASKAVEINPTFSQGWLFLGLLYEQIGNYEKALQTLKQCMNIMGPNPLLERHIVQLQLQHAPETAAPPSIQLSNIMELMEAKKHKTALALVQKALDAKDSVPYRLVKIELLCRMGQVQEGLTFLLDCINADPTNATWYKALNLINKAGADSALMAKTFEVIIQKYPNNLLAHLYYADFSLKTKDAADAMPALKNALSHADDPKMRTRIYFQLGMIHVRNNEWDEAFTQFKAGEELKESYAPLINALAYYYATKGNDYDKAQLLISDALKQDPNNPHFLDTQALIWYKQKHLDKAGKLLATLVDSEQQDWYINLHVAKVARAHGNTPQAQKYLTIALHNTPYDHKKQKYQQRLRAWSA